MKRFLVWFAGAIFLCSGVATQAYPIKDNSLNKHKVGWYLNGHTGNNLLSCEETCRSVGAVPEQARNLGASPVCKVRVPYWNWSKEIYGSQTYSNGFPACHVTDPNGVTRVSSRFHCLCVRASTTGCPDLIVENLLQVKWQPFRNATHIVVKFKNIGSAFSRATTANFIDQSTLDASTSMLYSTSANIPSLRPGESRIVTFTVPYKIVSPSARGMIKADHNNTINECRENNNTKWVWL